MLLEISRFTLWEAFNFFLMPLRSEAVMLIINWPFSAVNWLRRSCCTARWKPFLFLISYSDCCGRCLYFYLVLFGLNRRTFLFVIVSITDAPVILLFWIESTNVSICNCIYHGYDGHFIIFNETLMLPTGAVVVKNIILSLQATFSIGDIPLNCTLNIHCTR